MQEAEDMERSRFDILFTNDRVIPASELSVVGGMLAYNILRMIARIP